MKKIAFFLLTVIFICGYLYYHYKKETAFRCDTQLLTHIEIDNNKIETNLYITIAFTLDNNIFFEVSGSLKQGNQQYIVNRKIFFTTKPSLLNGMKKTIITHEVINQLDQVPEELWRRYFLPASPGVEFYAERIKLNKNAVLLQGFSNPLLVCVRSENRS